MDETSFSDKPPIKMQCPHPRFLFGKCILCRIRKEKTQKDLRPLSGLAVNPRYNEASKARRLLRIAQKVFELREQGFTVDEIAQKTRLSMDNVYACLNDRGNVRRRIESYNEQLRAYSPQAIKVVRDLLYSDDPRDKRQKREVALWILEATKVVGKESPVNIFVNAPGAQAVILNQDEIEAARSVADLMAAQKLLPEAKKPEIINVEVVATTEEKSVGGTTSSPNLPSV